MSSAMFAALQQCCAEMLQKFVARSLVGATAHDYTRLTIEGVCRRCGSHAGRGESGMATVFSRMDERNRFNHRPANDAGDGSGKGPDEAYRPGADEPFMSLRQQAYFRRKLTQWRDAILREAQGTLSQLQVDSLREADLTDRASSETDWSIELRTRDRQRKLIAKIDAALRRIDEGEYGYCDVTGEPISLARLEARPIATMTIEAQERHERHERVSRDD
jgi:DnaK suppressor protein